jgi:hypothetical protein
LYGARYREAWRLAEALRSRRGKDGFPDWVLVLTGRLRLKRP